VFGSDHAGILEGTATEEEIKATVPEVFEYVVNYRIGDEVPRFIHNGNSLGYALFDCSPQSGYCEIVNRLQHALRLEVT
jgi:hypothetical protein